MAARTAGAVVRCEVAADGAAARLAGSASTGAQGLACTPDASTRATRIAARAALVGIRARVHTRAAAAGSAGGAIAVSAARTYATVPNAVFARAALGVGSALEAHTTADVTSEAIGAIEVRSAVPMATSGRVSRVRYVGWEHGRITPDRDVGWNDRDLWHRTDIAVDGSRVDVAVAVTRIERCVLRNDARRTRSGRDHQKKGDRSTVHVMP